MKSLFRPFPLPLSGRQKFYLIVLQGIGAGLIDGGANFGIAYAMYSKQSVVKMWIFSQNTIAGDLGVTPIIQCLASMIISSTLVHTDLHNRAIQPLAFCYPHVENLPDPRRLFGGRSVDHPRGSGDAEKAKGPQTTSADSTPTSGHPTLPNGTPGGDEATVVGADVEKAVRTDPWASKGFWYYYWMFVRFVFEGTEKNMLAARPGVRSWFGRLGWTAAQGAAIGIIFGFPIWCLAIVILGPIYKMDNMGGKWAPQVIKCVYGAVVGWVTNPVIAILALGSQAEQSLIVVEHDEESEVGLNAEDEREASAGARRQDGMGEDDEEVIEPEVVPTIIEDEVFTAPQATTSSGTARAAPPSSFRLAPPPLPHLATAPAASATATHADPSVQSSPSKRRPRSRSSSVNSHISRSPTPSLFSSARPPLTANASFLTDLPSPGLQVAPLETVFSASSGSTSGRLRARSSAAATNRSPLLVSASLPSRQRGATVSEAHTAVPVPGSDGTAAVGPCSHPATPRSFSYCLGGAGGRAQRSRAGTVSSQVPSLVISPEEASPSRSPRISRLAGMSGGGGDRAGSPTKTRTVRGGSTRSGPPVIPQRRQSAA